MGRSTFISAALHAAILLFALVAFSSAKVDQAPLAIPIDLAATPSDVTKLKAGDADAKDDAALAGKPKEPKPQAVKEATPKPPDETAALTDAKPDKPKDDKSKPDTKTAEKKAEPQKTADAKPKPAKPAPKKRDFNADRIAALLNKIPDAADEAKPVGARRRHAPEKSERPVERHRNDHVGQRDRRSQGPHRAMLEPASRRARRRPDRDQAAAEAQ